MAALDCENFGSKFYKYIACGIICQDYSLPFFSMKILTMDTPCTHTVTHSPLHLVYIGTCVLVESKEA